MKTFISFCCIGIIYCLFRSCSIDATATSIMHQTYAAQYSMMAVLWFLGLLMIGTLEEIRKILSEIKADKNKIQTENEEKTGSKKK